MSAPAAASTADGAEQRIVVRRIVAAPREAVFRAWTEAEQLQRWWAPAGASTPHVSVDLRPGGSFHFCMRFDGREIWGIGVYREVVYPERLVYHDSFADAEGNPVPPAYYGFSAEHPETTRVSVAFRELPQGTEVVVSHLFPLAVPERAGTEQGWGEMLERLAALLAAV
jgi:uncharacterized protein YndB with AHSA1/START domain